MITEKTIISGTEEELLEYFKNKYNLIEKEVQEVVSILNTYEQSTASHSYATLPTAIPPYGAGEDIALEENQDAIPDPHKDGNFPNKPASVIHKNTTGLDNLFGGTSWGQ